MATIGAIALVLTLTGCTDDSASPNVDQADIESVVTSGSVTEAGERESTSAATAGIAVSVKVADGELRIVGDPCSGTGPYRQVHAGTAYEFVDTSGKAVASGILDQGRAEKSMNADFGPRAEPTDCIWTVYAVGVDSMSGLSMVIDGGEPLTVVDTEPGEIPKVLVV